MAAAAVWNQPQYSGQKPNQVKITLHSRKQWPIKQNSVGFREDDSSVSTAALRIADGPLHVATLAYLLFVAAPLSSYHAAARGRRPRKKGAPAGWFLNHTDRRNRSSDGERSGNQQDLGKADVAERASNTAELHGGAGELHRQGGAYGGWLGDGGEEGWWREPPAASGK